MANQAALQQWRQKKIDMGFDPAAIDSFIEEQRASRTQPQAQTATQQVGNQPIQPIEVGQTGPGINQPFGNPNEGLYGTSATGAPNINRGADLASTAGEKQVAPIEGNWVVESSTSDNSYNEGWGNSVVIKNTDTGETLRNSHLDKVYVQPGETVTGKELGTTGTTGRTTGAHKDIEYTTPEGQLADVTQSPYAGASMQSRLPPPESKDLPLMDTEPSQPTISAAPVTPEIQPEKPPIMSELTPSPSVAVEPIPTHEPQIDIATQQPEAAVYTLPPEVVESIPEGRRESAQRSASHVASALKNEGIDDPRVLAYAMATVEHEADFEPKEEIQGKQQAKKLGYEGGEDFYGRGYIQLTHRGNYEKFGQRVGEDLVSNPEKLLEPEVSAKVLAAYFKDNGVAEAIQNGEYEKARVLVQGPGATSAEFMPTTQKITKRAKEWEMYF